MRPPFRFQGLVRLREAEREAVRQELARLVGEAATIHAQRMELEQQKAAVVLRHREARVGVIRAETLRRQADHERLLLSEESRLDAADVALNLQIEQVRSSLLAAETECRRWETLARREEREWQARSAAAELLAIAEVNRQRVKAERS